MEAVIIDYNMCNLYSVQAALTKVNINSKISSSENEILEAKCAILPGVGSFNKAMDYIKEKKIDIIISKFIKTEKPLICICLGMQLLFEESHEYSYTKGLGLLKGKVIKFDFDIKKIPVPHTGWNQIHIVNNNNKLLSNLSKDEMMYFVHSYYAQPEDENIISTYTEYEGKKFCSSINYKNIYAFQFHPEKSSVSGLKIYENINKLIK
tara:strand:- start:656 stop:1279 length:624 start_codon:yes stop_codon:yes gene_type:complete